VSHERDTYFCGRPLFPDDGLRATLTATLESEGVPDPLHQPFTLGMIWLDLCRLADETPPAMVEAMLDMPAAWPLSDVFDGIDRVRRRVAVPRHTATVPKKGGGGW